MLPPDGFPSNTIECLVMWLAILVGLYAVAVLTSMACDYFDEEARRAMILRKARAEGYRSYLELWEEERRERG